MWSEVKTSVRHRGRACTINARRERDMGRASSLMLSGRCECRAVRYRVADEFLYAANCHCSNCRAGTGSVQAVCRHRAGQAQSRRGADRLLVWGDDTANHTRCGVCGSLLYSVVRDGAYVHVAMGSLEDNPSISPTEHIFVGSKAPWFNITDDLPQLEEHYQGHARPRFQAAPRRRTARERRRSAFGMGCSRNQAPTVIAPCRGGYPVARHPLACARAVIPEPVSAPIVIHIRKGGV